MPLTRITGQQVLDQSITEDDLSLSDVTAWNATIGRHGFCPKLPNNANLFLNGVGAWVQPQLPGVPTPTNTYFVSPAFSQNSGQYWSDLKLLEQEINALPLNRAPLIIVYPGAYVWQGNLEFNRFFSIIATGAHLQGTLKITYGGEIYAKDVSQVILNNLLYDVTINAHKILELDVTGPAEASIKINVNRVEVLNLLGYVSRCNIYANMITEGVVVQGSGYHIYGSKINGNITISGDGRLDLVGCLVISAQVNIGNGGIARFYNTFVDADGVNLDGARLALNNCYVASRIQVSNGDLLLANANVREVDGVGTLFVRGESTTSQPVPSSISLSTPTNVIVNPAYDGEIYFYM